MNTVKRYGHISYLVEACPAIVKLYPAMTIYVMANDFDTLAAAYVAAGEREHALQIENHLLRQGMQGDYDLDAWLDWAKTNFTLRDRITSLHHVGMELTGVIDEYRAMPCDSLQVRMFQTADRYRLRLTAKCQTCKDTGVILTPGATLDDNWVRVPCPDCAGEQP